MQRRVVVASTFGTALEWYDFSLYGLAAALVLDKAFFAGGETFTTLASFATFAIGFVFRPVGGAIIGHFGDRVGRRTMLFVTLGMMGTSTTLIGLLPTYASIGALAPVLLVLLRIVQGLGSGGEYVGAALMTTEHADPARRGFWGSFPVAGNGAGILLASGSFAAVSALPQEMFLAWGWRIPFVLSFVVAGVGLYIRLKVAETPAFEQVRQANQVTSAPLVQAVRTSPRRLVLAFFSNFAPNLAGYIPAVFALSYVSGTVGAPERWALFGVMAATSVRVVTPVLFGSLSDRVGRKPVYIGAALFVAALSFPFFFLLDTGSAVLIAVAIVALLGIGDGALLGAQPAFYVELFGPQVRYSAIAMAREFSAALIGGTAPFVASLLVAATGGSPWLIATYMTAVFVLSAVATSLLPETRGTDLANVNVDRDVRKEGVNR